MKKFLGLLIILSLLLSFFPVFNFSYSKTSVATVLDVTLTPNIVGELVRIDIKFTLTVDVSANSDNIVITFPKDLGGDSSKEFTLPAIIPKTSVLIDGSNNISDVQVDMLNRKVAVITSINLNSGTANPHVLTFLTTSGIKNPTKSGFYSLKFNTSQETTPANSPNFYIYPGVFDHVEVIPSPAFFTSNRYALGPTSEFYLARYGSSGIMDLLPSDMYGNTLFEGYTYTFGNFVRPEDKDCGYETYDIPTARWFLVYDPDHPSPGGKTPVNWHWWIPGFSSNYAIRLSSPGNKSDDTSLFIHPLYNKNISDFILETKISFDNAAGYHGGVKFRFNDYLPRYNPNANGYYVDIWGGNIRLLKTVNGVETLITQSPLPAAISANTWYTLKIIANGSNIQVFWGPSSSPLPTTPIINATDTTFTSGIFGVWQYGGDATVRRTDWDDFTIKTSTGTTLYSDNFETKIAAPDDPPDDGVDANFRYCDSNSNGIYDCMDCVYLDLDNSFSVTRGDIRITASTCGGSYGPGSIVKAGDSDIGITLRTLNVFLNPSIVKAGDEDIGGPALDIGTGLVNFGTNEKHAENVNSDNNYNPGEWIYRDALLDPFPNFVSPGDTRLTNVTIGSTTYPINSVVSNPFVKHTDGGPTVNAYDPGEYIYQDNDNNNIVSIGDIRLTQVGIYLAGSIVAAGDTDIGTPLILFMLSNPPTAIPEKFVDANVNLMYNIGEWIYRDNDTNKVVSPGDIRLTNVTIGATTYVAGSTVALGDLDVGRALIPFGDLDLGEPLINFGSGGLNERHAENVNSNGIFDPGEWIYNDADNSNSVTNNDGRLTSVTIGATIYPAGSTVTSGYALSDFSSNEKFYDYDFSGPTNLTTEDWIYRDNDNSGTVSVGDMRLSNVTFGNKSYPAGSTVLASDTDIGLVLNSIDNTAPAPIYRYVDSDNSGTYSPFERIYDDVNASGTINIGDIRIRTPSLRYYNTDTSKEPGLDSCDFVYLDLDNSMTPSECDVRLTPVNIWTTNSFAHYEAGSKVKITDLDASKLDPLQVIWPFMMLKQYNNNVQRLFFDYHFGDYNSNKVWDDNEPINFIIDFVWNFKKVNGITKNVVSPGDLRISTNYLITASLTGTNPGIVDINGFYTAPVLGSADPPYEVTLNVTLTVGGISRTGSSKIVLFRGPPKVTLSPQTQWLAPCTEYQYKAIVTDINGNPIPYAENNVNFGVGYPKNTKTNNYLMPYPFGFTGTYPEDLNMQLVEFSNFEKHADNVLINVPANNGKYDYGEWIYRDNDLSNSVSPGDLRLTKVYKAGKTYAPGTTVQLGDWDNGTALIAFNNLKERHTQHINSNAPYPPAFDPGEYIYSDEDSNFAVSFGDIRLSDVKRGAVFYAAGTKVNDKDIGDSLKQFADDLPGGVDVLFVDLNGNGVFDPGYWFQSNNDWYYFPGEWLYIDIDTNGVVSPGDYRILSCSCLSNCSICGSMGLTPGYVLATNHDQGYTLSTDTNIDEKIKFIDRNSNGSWDYLTEPLYWDKNGDSYVTKDDVRLTDVSTPGATIDKNGKFSSSSCAGGEYSIWASFTYNNTCVDGTCGGAVVYNSIPTYAIVTTAVRVEVSPRDITLISGERVQFTAVALDPLDHVVITPTPIWSLLNMDPMYPIGTIDSSTGLFTASSDRCVEGYAIATIHTTCCGDISSTLPPPEENRTSAKIKVNSLVDVLEQTISFSGAEIGAKIKWFVDQSGDKLKVTVTTSLGTSKELYFTPPTASSGTWQDIFVNIPITELGITTIGTTITVTIRGDVIPSYPSSKWCTFDLYSFTFTTTPLLSISGNIFTIGTNITGKLTTLADLNSDGNLDPLQFIQIVLSGPYNNDLILEPWGSTSVVNVQTDLNGTFNLGTGWVDSLGYHGAKYDGIYKIEALSSPPTYKYVYLKYKDTITTDLSKLTVDLNSLQTIEGTLQLPNSLTPGNNDVYVELWKVDPVKGYERVNISSGPINEIVRTGFPPQTYAPVKLGANGYFKIYALIDELGSYALFTRVGNQKSSLGDYEYGRYYDQSGAPTPYRPFTIGAPNYKATLLVEPTVLYANKLNYFTIFVTDPSGNPVDEVSLNLKDKFTFELPPGWTLQNKMVKPLTKGTYLISGTPVGTGSGSMIVKVAGAVLLSLPIQPLSLYNPYAYIDFPSEKLDREMIPPVVGGEYILVFGFYQPPTPGLVVFDPDKNFEIDKDDTVFIEEISRSDSEIKVKFVPTMYTELPINLKFSLRGVDDRTNEENGKVSTDEITFKLFSKFTKIDGFKIKVETNPQEIVQGGVGSISITVLDVNDVPRKNAWVEIWGYNKDGSQVSDMFNVSGPTPKIIIDASHLDPLNQNILNGVYTQSNVGFNHASDPEKDRVPFEVGRYTLVKVYTGDPSIPTSKIMGYIPYAFVVKPKKTLNISLLSIDGMTTYNKILAGRKHQLLINAPGVPAGSEIIAVGSRGSTFVNNMNGTFTLTLGEPYLEEGDARIVAIGPNRDTFGEIYIPITKPKLIITPSDNILSAEINETITFSLFDPITNAPFYTKEVGVDGKIDSFGAPFGFRSAIMNKVSLSGVSSGTLTVNGRDNTNPTLPDSPKIILYYSTNDTPVGKYVILNEFDLVSVKVTVEISTPQGTIIEKAIVGKANRIKITVVDAHNAPVANAEVGITFAYNYAQTIYDLKGYTDNSGVVSFTNFIPKYAGGYDIVVKKQDKEYVFYDYFYAREVTEDTTPPKIEIIEPEDGKTFDKTKVEVFGKVVDDSSVTAVYVNGMRVDLLPDGTFMTYVTLDEGTNRIRVIAVDEFGNIGTKEIYVIYKPPTLNLTLEPVPLFVNTPQLKIKGTTDKGATVYVNDEEIDVDEDGNFETVVILIEGLNTITVRAEKGTLTRTKRISVTLDTTPPKLQVTIPDNVLERVFEVKGTTEVGATLTINDEPVLVNPDGSFSYILTIPVGENELSVTVKAQDKAGNTNVVSKVVKYRREIIIEMIIDSPVIKVTKDGVTTTVIYEIAPFTMPPGRTMVPLRFIAETFGAKVDWDPKTEGIHIELKKSDGTMVIIDMQLGNKIAYVNGKPYVLDVAPFTVEPQGRTVVPIRFIAEAFGASVDWDPVLQKVTITYYP
ncbi:MAG: hypothetical protein H5U37_00550 [Caldisericia bacterium]|nr:hypothetical protein [Caldisericia bacterium]